MSAISGTCLRRGFFSRMWVFSFSRFPHRINALRELRVALFRKGERTPHLIVALSAFNPIGYILIVSPLQPTTFICRCSTFSLLIRVIQQHHTTYVKGLFISKKRCHRIAVRNRTFGSFEEIKKTKTKSKTLTTLSLSLLQRGAYLSIQFVAVSSSSGLSY